MSVLQTSTVETSDFSTDLASLFIACNMKLHEDLHGSSLDSLAMHC